MHMELYVAVQVHAHACVFFYLIQCAYVRLLLCLCAEQEGPQQRLWVRCKLGQDACYQEVDGDGVFQKVL